MSPLGLDDHWWWLLFAALLGILEIFVPGIFLIWMAAAAAITGLLAAMLPIALPFQLAIFGLLALAAVYSGRRYYDANPVDSADPLLNDRTARLIGQSVTVVTAIENGEGRVKVGDFGLSRDTSDSYYGDAVRWSAPEVLQQQEHTEKSDVWALGVVIWEIFSMFEILP